MDQPRTDNMASDPSMDKTKALDYGHVEKARLLLTKAVKNIRMEEERRKGKFMKELTLVLELSEGAHITPLAFLKATQEVCGSVVACRLISKDKYEVTVSTTKAKERLLDGYCIGGVRVHARDISVDELVVSFMGLPAYIEDEEILSKLYAWGVSAVSEVRRRMWPGTNVADGTRFVRVRFTDTVQSLPYSVRFDTAGGPEYFRVIHDRQVRVCRGCLQPGHILRECPDFLCRNCGSQGHYARECVAQRAPKCRDCRMFRHLCPCGAGDREEDRESASGEEREAGGESSDVAQSVPETVLSEVEEVDLEVSAMSEESGSAGSSDSADSSDEDEPEPIGLQMVFGTAQASGKVGAENAKPTVPPDQREGTREGLPPQPVEAEAEPGRRMDAGQAPHLTSKGEDISRATGDDPKPSGKRGEVQRRKEKKTKSTEAGERAATQGQRASSASHGKQVSGDGESVAPSSIPTAPKGPSKQPTNPPSSARSSAPHDAHHTIYNDDLMDFSNTDTNKKRIRESDLTGKTKKTK